MLRNLLILITIISGLCCTQNKPAQTKQGPVKAVPSKSYSLDMTVTSIIYTDSKFYPEVISLYKKVLPRFPQGTSFSVSKYDSTTQKYDTYMVNNTDLGIRYTPTNLMLTDNIPSQVLFYTKSDGTFMFQESFVKTIGPYYSKESGITENSVVSILKILSTWKIQ